MTAVTELVHVSLKHGLDIKSEGSEGKQTLDHVLKTISEQHGCTNLATGTTVENHDDMDMLVDWTDIKHHESFMAADYYAPFMDQAGKLVTGEPGCLTINHIHFSSPVKDVTEKAPVIEMLMLYVSASASDEVPGTVARFMDIVKLNAKGFVGTAHGWVIEELEKEGFDEKLKGYFVAIGWDSVDAHMAYRETEPFKESIPMLRSLAKGLKVHHTSFTKYNKS